MPFLKLVQVPAIALAALIVGSGCHVTRRSTESVESSRSLRLLPETAKPHGEAVVVTAEGRLRFVEPLVCSAEVVVEGEQVEVVSKQANLATVVVGIITRNPFTEFSRSDRDSVGARLGRPRSRCSRRR